MLKSKLVGEAWEKMKSPRAQPLAQLSNPSWLFCFYFGHVLSLPSFAFISPFLMPLPSSVNVSSSVYLTSHSQWPSLHQTVRNRNSGVAFDPSLRLSWNPVSYTWQVSFPPVFSSMPPDHHLRPQATTPPGFLQTSPYLSASLFDWIQTSHCCQNDLSGIF